MKLPTNTLVAFLLALVTAPGMAACAGGSPAPPPPASTLQTAEAPPSYQLLVTDNFADPSVPRITASDLKARLDLGDSIILIDTRSESKFKTRHLAGAVSIRYAVNSPFPGEEDAMETALAALPDHVLKVLYCD